MRWEVWAVGVGGWQGVVDWCVACGAGFGGGAAFYAGHEPGLVREKCRRPGMKPLHSGARDLAERFAGERLDCILYEKSMHDSAKELREAALAWIEHHMERRLATRELLEIT